MAVGARDGFGFPAHRKVLFGVAAGRASVDVGGHKITLLEIIADGSAPTDQP
ncbi:hypothetical protein BLSMQ_0405 [Brevibacterium aurantiacum]|uniref:Uncharacterized protein n=1 Tax=Brevibacterium aurantiacum TaxID=273384 RepID=A0A1D7VZF9_BREAU|nr:hypothetical protein BLSMQ_0405 [Brevibacterium aurantiacum]